MSVCDKVIVSKFGVHTTMMNLLTDRRKNQQEKQKCKPVLNSGSRRWSTLPLIKVNINDVVFMEIGCVCIGNVIRDENGEFVRARSQKITAKVQRRKVEAVGLKEALSWTKRLGFKRCIFETDAKTLVDA